MHDYITLEMELATLMAQQEASGFRFDETDAAERVKSELMDEVSEQIEYTDIKSRSIYVPGKVFTPKRKNALKGITQVLQ